MLELWICLDIKGGKDGCEGCLYLFFSDSTGGKVISSLHKFVTSSGVLQWVLHDTLHAQSLSAENLLFSLLLPQIHHTKNHI